MPSTMVLTRPKPLRPRILTLTDPAGIDLGIGARHTAQNAVHRLQILVFIARAERARPGQCVFSLLLPLSAAETLSGLNATLPLLFSACSCAAAAGPYSASPAPIRLAIILIFIYPQK